MNRSFVLGLTFLLSVPALAAVAPYHQRVREMRAVLESVDLEKRISAALSEGASGQIDSIEDVGDARRIPVYEVTSGACKVDVWIRYVINGTDGAPAFKVLVDPKMACRRP